MAGRWHHHEWAAGPTDSHWHCTAPDCTAEVHELEDTGGRIIPLPINRGDTT